MMMTAMVAMMVMMMMIAHKAKGNGIWNHIQAVQCPDLCFVPLTHQPYFFPKAFELSPPTEKEPGFCPNATNVSYECEESVAAIGVPTVLLCSVQHSALSWMLLLMSPDTPLGLASPVHLTPVAGKGICSLGNEILAPLRTVGKESVQAMGVAEQRSTLSVLREKTSPESEPGLIRVL